MKAIFGFLIVVFSVVIFVPSRDMGIDNEVESIEFKEMEYHYQPTIEVIESRRKLDECKRKIRANITYLITNENTQTN